ncbi:hypothetical protein DPMN_107571, partial [Dreissena polymorpha]
MQETLHEHRNSFCIGKRPICNLRFADCIDLMGATYGMEIMVKSTTNASADITMDREKLEEDGT